VRLLENGVDLDHFGPGASGACPPLPPGPRAVYTGALDERFGLASLRMAAERLPEVAFVLAGPPGAGIRALAATLPNIHLLGQVPYATLPALLAHCHVALLPMSAHPANEGRSPMKLYEYAASGLSVVATATSELHRRAPDFVRLAASDEAFAEHLRAAVAEPRGSYGAPLAAARIQGWEAKCQQVLTWSSDSSSASA
jgi:glycosyltransferase involved in cell wall biosynthesis